MAVKVVEEYTRHSLSSLDICDVCYCWLESERAFREDVARRCICIVGDDRNYPKKNVVQMEAIIPGSLESNCLFSICSQSLYYVVELFERITVPSHSLDTEKTRVWIQSALIRWWKY